MALGERRRTTLVHLSRRGYRAALRAPGLRHAMLLPPVQRLRRALQHPARPEDVVEVVDLLAAAGIRCWLAGGWGVDALIGRQTRTHADLDLIVDQGDAAAAESVLAEHGFRLVPESVPGSGHRYAPGAVMPVRVLLQDRAGRVVDLHPVDVRGWPRLPSVSEGFATGVVAGRAVDCVSVEAQIAGHRGYELPDRERRDLELLERMLATPPDSRRTPA
jgi:lincosamide nucleotidyltransferase A/C/D/E